MNQPTSVFVSQKFTRLQHIDAQSDIQILPLPIKFVQAVLALTGKQLGL